MANENRKILLKEVPTKLREARKVAKNVPYELHDLCDYLAQFASKELDPSGLALLLACACDDLEKECCGFNPKVVFPERLKEEKERIFIYLSFFPLIVDEISGEEFAEEFRGIFTPIFGEAQPPVSESTEDLGLTIIEPGVIDICNKDKAEVLAELYNHSHPHGLGFLQFIAKPMTIEEARELLEKQTYFDYLNGRVMKIDLTNNIVRTAGYNRDNGDGAAERVIAGCRNVQ